MYIMKKILTFALMSVMVSAVTARTAKVKMTQADSVIIESFLEYTELSLNDKLVVRSLVRHQNAPLEGAIAVDGAVHPKAKYGDEWTAYISLKKESYYLTYEVRKPNGRKLGKVYLKI